MLFKEIAIKIKEELSSFFGNSLPSIVLYGYYAGGKESKYSDIDISTTLRNFNPLLLVDFQIKVGHLDLSHLSNYA
jgi:predicted nucleotidyltransferase